MVSPQKISSYIRKPYALDAEAETQLREVIQEYPYFSNAWLLLTRSLHNQNSPKFDASLKQASMYAGDRDLLYKLVNITDGEEEKKPSFTENKETVVAVETPTQKVESPVKVEEAKEEIKTTTPAIDDTAIAATQEIKETKEAIIEELATENTTAIVETEKELSPIENIEETAESIVQETKESVEEDVTTIENTVAETVENTEETITTEVNETTETLDTEQEKVKSAYEKIFGSQDDNDESTVSTEFETFDIKDRLDNEEPALPDFDEDDFVLQVDENDSEDLMVDEMANASIANEPETIANTAVEDATNNDANIESAVPQETYVEETEFELDTIDLQNDEVSEVDTPSESFTTKEEGVESELSETIDTNLAFSENKIDSVPNEVENIVETANENTETVDNATSENEIGAVSEAQNDEVAIDNTPEEVNTVDEAIAFKLEGTETPRIEETQESIEQVATPIQDQTFTQASSFFEWLTQLKNPEKEEKKNDITQGAISTVVSQSHQAPIYVEESSTASVSEKKPDADAIIERFIKINPTISRPKVEFYNPEAKSKESDTESDDLATETLAKIYRDQKLNDKAIEVYQRLKLIYPNKAAEYSAIIAEIENE